MKGGGNITAAALVLLLLTLGAEAEKCSTPVHSPYPVWCFTHATCVALCIVEGSTGGHCAGFLRKRCMCTKSVAAAEEEEVATAVKEVVVMVVKCHRRRCRRRHRRQWRMTTIRHARGGWRLFANAISGEDSESRRP